MGALHFLGSVPGTSGVPFVNPVWLSLVPGTRCALLPKFTLKLKCTLKPLRVGVALFCIIRCKIAREDYANGSFVVVVR